MTDSHTPGVTRRDVLQAAGTVVAASALAGVAIPQVHAASDNAIRVALVGCGGRGTGAATDALKAKGGPIKLVAMADVFNDRLTQSYKHLTGDSEISSGVNVPEDHKFIGFDGYQKAIDCLRKGDVVILTTPPAFRWVHFTYAIEKGVNVFMEKPVAVDGPSARRMFKLGEEASKAGLKVGVGLMCRHCDARHALLQEIQKGTIGDITLLQAYRQKGPEASSQSGPRSLYQPKGTSEKEMSELEYQIRRFHSFLWASGGCYSDFLIHNIDECCWMKGDWPVMAEGAGGRHYREIKDRTGKVIGPAVDQNFDVYSVEYTFKDGTKLQLEGRTMPGCRERFASYVHGTKGSGIISFNSHSPARPRLYKGHNLPPVAKKADLVWEWGKPEPNPYQLEWDHLIAAIRDNKPYNEVERGTKASLVTSMGRMAAHTGQTIEYDYILNSQHEFGPTVDKLTLASAAPLQAGPDGKYPVPQPGRGGRPYREF
jgi:predicted dehydrogenase